MSTSVSLRATQISTHYPAGVGALVTLTPVNGRAYVEFTFDPETDILNNTARWSVWPNGTVTSQSVDTAAYNMFVRAWVLSGQATLTVDDPIGDADLWSTAMPWKSRMWAGVPNLTQANTTAAATANATAIQAALTAGGFVQITTPGIYCVNNTLTIPDNTTVYIGPGVILVRLNGGSACTIFQNADRTNGNKNIKIYGEGVLYFNANGYVNAYNANTADCPYFANLFTANISGLVESGGTIFSGSPNVHGIVFDNVTNGYVGGGLTLMMAQKYQIYGSQITNCTFENLVIYSDDTINPANGSTIGRDGIHIQGNSSGITVRNVRGTVNDDAIVFNVRDVGAWAATARATGPIRNITVENIRFKNQRRAGSVVIFYGGLDVGTVDVANTNGFDVAPAISSIVVSSGGLYTVTTASAHNMQPGDAFTIYNSNPVGFNTNTAGFATATITTPVGRIQAVPSTTTFTYFAPGGASLTYTSGAKLVRYYAIQNARVSNVQSVSGYNAGVVAFAVTTDSASNFGIVDNVDVREATGYVTNPVSTTGIVSSNFCRIHNSSFDTLWSTNNAAYAMLYLVNGGHLYGVSKWKNIWTEAPFNCTSTGYSWFGANGQYQTLEIEGADVTLNPAGSGFDYGIGVGAAGGICRIKNSINRQGPQLGVTQLFTATSSDMGNVVVENCTVASVSGDTRAGLGNVAGAVASGTLTVNGLSLPYLWYSPMINYYGTNVTINVQGNKLVANSGGQGGMIQYYNAGTLRVNDLGNDYGTDKLFNANSTATTVSVYRGISTTQALTSGAAPAVNCNLGNNITLATGANAVVTLGAPSNVPPAGERVTFTITQDATGGRTVAWNAAYIFSGGAFSNVGNTANKKTTVNFISDGTALVTNGLNTWY